MSTDGQRVQRYKEAIWTPGDGRVYAVMAVADAEQAGLRAEKVRLRRELDDAEWRATMSANDAEDAEAKVARVEAVMDIRARARAWMAHLGYEEHQIDKAEAWRQPSEPWLQGDPPTSVVDLEMAAGFAREYEEALHAALDGPGEVGRE